MGFPSRESEFGSCAERTVRYKAQHEAALRAKMRLASLLLALVAAPAARAAPAGRTGHSLDLLDELKADVHDLDAHLGRGRNGALGGLERKMDDGWTLHVDGTAHSVWVPRFGYDDCQAQCTAMKIPHPRQGRISIWDHCVATCLGQHAYDATKGHGHEDVMKRYSGHNGAEKTY